MNPKIKKNLSSNLEIYNCLTAIYHSISKQINNQILYQKK